MSVSRQWWPLKGAQPVEPSNPCPSCESRARVHLGWAPTGGIRFAVWQVVTTSRIHMGVCSNCGLTEVLLDDDVDLAVANASHTWTKRPDADELYVDVASGRASKRPLARA